MISNEETLCILKLYAMVSAAGQEVVVRSISLEHAPAQKKTKALHELSIRKP